MVSGEDDIRQALADATVVEAPDDTTATVTPDPKGQLTQKERLLTFGTMCELFHTPEREGFAVVPVKGHYETWAVRSSDFRRWLLRQYFEITGQAPTGDAMAAALATIDAMAQFSDVTCDVHTRVALDNGKVYLDLADDDWRVVEVDDCGYRVLDRSPVRFRRLAGMRELPAPVPGGSIDDLRQFVNVADDDDFVLLVAYILAALGGGSSYPVLVLTGEQGSAKSTASAVIRKLVDPNSAPLRAPTSDERMLYIAARNGHVLAFDNVSYISEALSDALCRLSTGGGFASRTLYTDTDETLFFGTRPIILNGIGDVVTRPDLMDRCIFVRLTPILKEDRRPETDIWSAFEQLLPALLGALLSGVACGLRRWPHIQLPWLPRMADFARWASACETAFWPEGTFLAAYERNRDGAADDALASSTVAQAVLELMALRGTWSGTAKALLDLHMTGDSRHALGWPKSPRALSNELRRINPLLRKAGIDVSWHKGRERLIQLSWITERGASASSPASPASDSGPSLRDSATKGDEAASNAGAVASHADARDPDICDAGDAEDDQTDDDSVMAWRARL